MRREAFLILILLVGYVTAPGQFVHANGEIALLPRSTPEGPAWSILGQLKTIAQHLGAIKEQQDRLIKQVEEVSSNVKPPLPGWMMAGLLLLAVIQVLGTRVGYAWALLLQKTRPAPGSPPPRGWWGMLSWLILPIHELLKPFEQRDDDAAARARDANERADQANARVAAAIADAATANERSNRAYERANRADGRADEAKERADKLEKELREAEREMHCAEATIKALQEKLEKKEKQLTAAVEALGGEEELTG